MAAVLLPMECVACPFRSTLDCADCPFANSSYLDHVLGVEVAMGEGASLPDEGMDRERLTRAEVQMSAIGASVIETKRLVEDLARRLDQTYCPRGELDQRFAALDMRLQTQEARTLGLPPWVAILGSFLIGVISLLGGTLIGLIIHSYK